MSWLLRICNSLLPQEWLVSPQSWKSLFGQRISELAGIKILSPAPPVAVFVPMTIGPVVLVAPLMRTSGARLVVEYNATLVPTPLNAAMPLFHNRTLTTP